MIDEWQQEKSVARQTARWIFIVWFSWGLILALMHLQTWLAIFTNIQWGIAWVSCFTVYSYFALRTGFDFLIFTWFASAHNEATWRHRVFSFDRWLSKKNTPSPVQATEHRTMHNRQHGVYRLLFKQSLMAIIWIVLIALYPK
ncbi:hypothetical protein LIN78_12765 [Leeia sp. TBRC 13508]|uniref:Uncharacterized protein n=1 Tax=Leeia speluncae TaxID=2884804 RepID=A0ABS8D881_9NEIS|nr:hypothetical protein [Leeia speluncae]MCB6184418.1 hypothetical protein [Leeia speluncae]